MNESEHQRGIDEAQNDIAAESCRLFFQTRGRWGELLTTLMRNRFQVEVIHTSDITSDGQRSYQEGYNSTVTMHLDSKFGQGSFDRTWEEVQEYRKQSSYRSRTSPEHERDDSAN
jgi:hypothetical protein